MEITTDDGRIYKARYGTEINGLAIKRVEFGIDEMHDFVEGGPLDPKYAWKYVYRHLVRKLVGGGEIVIRMPPVTLPGAE